MSVATLTLQINNLTVPVNETFTAGTSTINLVLPAGPYVEAEADGATLGFGDGVSFTADLHFDQGVDSTGAKVTRLAVANLNFNGSQLGGGESRILSNGQGGLVITANGVAGVISGKLSGSAGPITASGTVGLRINTTNGPVNQTITVNGTAIVLNFPSGTPRYQIFVTNATVSFGNVFEVHGDVSASGDGFAGANLELFLGAGPYRNPDNSINPNAIGILLSNATVGVINPSGGGVQLHASGTIALIGVSGLDIAVQTATIDLNTSGTTVDETLTVPGQTTTQTVRVFFPNPGITASFVASGLTLTAGTILQIGGSFAFSKTPDGTVNVAITGASIKLNLGSSSAPAGHAFDSPDVELDGSAAFSLGGANGFSLSSFSVNGFKVFGVGLDAPAAPAAPVQFPTADLASPTNGGVIDRTKLNAQGYVDVQFSDPNNLGLNASTITDASPEFTVTLNGQSVPGLTFVGTPTAVPGFINTYRYAFSGTFPTAGDVSIQFAAGAFADSGGHANFAATEGFSLVNPASDGTLPAPAPTAILGSPADGTSIDASSLNARRYLDVTFLTRGPSPIDPTSINGDEITVSGTGATDVKKNANGTLVLLGLPQFLSGTTYRYYLTDATAGSTTLFSAGTVEVDIRPNTFTTVDGTVNVAAVQMFTIGSSASGGATSSKGITLGPLSLVGPTVSLGGLKFKDGLLYVTVAIGADQAGLNFGGSGKTSGTSAGSQQSSSGVSVNLTGILGTLEVGVDVFGLLSGHVRVSVPGKFSLSVAGLSVVIPNVVNVQAAGIVVKYDPAGPSNQELVKVDSATITFPRFGVSGIIAPFTSGTGANATTIPGLDVRMDGFTLGFAELRYGSSTPTSSPLTNTGANPTGKISFGSILTFDDLRIGVQNFNVNFNAPLSSMFSGTIFVASGGASLFPGKAFSATLTAAPTKADGTPNDEAVRVGLTFGAGGTVDAFQFSASILTVQLGSFLSLSARNFMINTGASASQEVVSFTSLAATVKIGSLSIGGEARNFGFLGDGSFEAKAGFGVFLTVGSMDGSGFKWPSFLPIQINEIGIQWDNIQQDPSNFNLILSASVTAIKGVPGLQFSGSIEGVKISPSLLFQGKDPITDIASIGVSVKGNLFGGTIDAALIGGILKLDNNANLIDPLDTTTPVAKRIFFLGVQGGFSMDGIGGLTIRFALSDLGPLSVLISVEVPGGILLEPITGLTINDFVAGVDFFSTLPSISDPKALRSNAFQIPTAVPVAQWLPMVKQQVVAQYRAILANPSLNGFTAAFTSPMVITGSATVYTIYTSQAVFNGQVTVKISTDGKFLIIGTLNFAADKVSISGRLYADLSQVSSGSVTVLFLADIPDQVKLLTIFGKLQMGFENASGQPVSFTVVGADPNTAPGAAPTASLLDPSAPNVDYASINAVGRSQGGVPYIDVSFMAPTGASLDYGSILDADPEFTLAVGGVGKQVNGTPLPMVSTVNADGTTTMTPLVPNSGETLIQAIQRTGTNRFRYLITEPGFTFPKGPVTLNFAAGTFKDSDVTLANGTTSACTHSAAYTATFNVQGATAVLADPGSNSSIDINSINKRNYIDVSFSNPSSPSGLSLDVNSVIDPDPEFTLSGPGLGTVKVDTGRAPVLVSSASGVSTFRYWLIGQYAAAGDVTLAYIPGSWGYDVASPPSPTTQTLSLVNNAAPATITVTIPDNVNGFPLDPNSILNGDADHPKIAIATDGNWTVAINTNVPPVQIGQTDQYQFALSVTLPASNPTASVTATITYLPSAWWYSPSAVPEPMIASADLGNLASTNGRSFIDVTYVPIGGGTIDAATILDSTSEFTLSGPGAAGVTALSVAPTQVSADTFRYYLSGQFVPGAVSVDFAADRFKDVGDASGATSSNLAFSQAFTVSGTTAHLVYNLSGTAGGPLADLLNNKAVGKDVFNGNGFIAVNFQPTDGQAIDPSTINGDEITLTDSTGKAYSLGQPHQVGTSNTYTYAITSSLAVGTYTVTFKAGSFADLSGQTNLASSESFRIQSPTAALTNPAPAATVDRESLNSQGYIDVTFTPTDGATVDASSLTGHEFTLTGANGENIVIRGPPTQPDPTNSPNTFRYAFGGQFDTGTLTINFIAGSWKDSNGNFGAASSQTLNIITQASAFFIELSGGIELNAAGLLDKPLLSLTADVQLEIDTARHVFTLTFTGQLSIYGLGTVGASAGKFILDTSNTLSNGPEFWGVASLATNFSALLPYGINLYASGTLQINTTNFTKTESITLPGVGPGGSDLTQTYTLPPLSFTLDLVGQLKLTVPGTSLTLLTLNGGFFLHIDPSAFELYETAELSFGVGPAQIVYGSTTGLLEIITGIGTGATPGVAGFFQVSKSAGVGLPNVGTLFQATGTVSVMFNTTFQDQSFKIPDAFLPLLNPGDPTTIPIFAAPPKLDGSKDPNGVPSVYIVATVQAHLNIGGVLTLDGFLQIAAGGNGDGAFLKVTGAVGTTIGFLGSLEGTLNFNVYLGANPGVVGRVFLTLNVNGIPGVALNGQFLLELDTYADSTNDEISTFAISKDANGNFAGFVHDANGNLVEQDQTLTVRSGFILSLSGTLVVGGIVNINGSFTIDISAAPDPHLQVTAIGLIVLNPIGSLAFSGKFRIDGTGLKAYFLASRDASFGASVGLSFSTSVAVKINTTGVDDPNFVNAAGVMLPTGVTTDLPAGVDVHLNGTVSFAGFASASGDVDIYVGPNGFRLQFAVQFDLAGLDFSASGIVDIVAGSDPGFVLNLAVSVDANIGSGVIVISASGMLQINTTNTARDGVNAKTFELALTGSVKFLDVLNASANFTVIVSNGAWSVSFGAQIDFFGLATLAATGSFDSTGDFNLTLTGDFLLGSHSFGLEGGFTFHIQSTHTFVSNKVHYIFDLSGSANVDVFAFGIDLAGVGLGFSFHAEGAGRTPLTLTVDVRIHLLFFTITKTAHFTIGYLQLPESPQLAGNTTGDPTGFDGGSLTLNTGPRAGDRNVGQPDPVNNPNPDESYTISQVAGDSTNARLKIVGFGRTEFYPADPSVAPDVTSINAILGDGNNTIIIDPSVQIPVHITGGSGNDVLINGGSGSTYFDGAGGDDYIENDSNSSSVTLIGGPGNDTIYQNGTAGATIWGDGQGDPDTNPTDSSHFIGGDPTQVGGDAIYGGVGNDVIHSGSGSAVIYGRGGADAIFTGTGRSVVNVDGTEGGTVVHATAGNSSDSSQETTVYAAGTTGNDSFTVSEGGLLLRHPGARRTPRARWSSRTMRRPSPPSASSASWSTAARAPIASTSRTWPAPSSGRSRPTTASPRRSAAPPPSPARWATRSYRTSWSAPTARPTR